MDSVLRTMLPDKLYRFRNSSHIDQEIQDMQQGLLFLPFARNFNDIKDAVVFVDRTAVIGQIEEQLTPVSFTKLMDTNISSIPDQSARIALSLYKKKVLANFEESRAAFVSDILDGHEDACRRYREQFRVACLTEELGSTTMWAHYAASGTGYCVEYDFKKQEALHCSCRNRCCRSGSQLLPVYPVIYDGQFDATLLSHVVMNKFRMSPIPTAGDYLTQVNALVHKTPNWSYESEWRVVAADCDQMGHSSEEKMYANLSAKAIYLGYAISEENEEKLKTLSRDTGIPLYRVEDDNSSPTATFRYLPVAN